MSKQHPHVATLKKFQRWRRGADLKQPAPAEVGTAIDWAIGVCEAAGNLVKVSGRHHSEDAYLWLEEAVKEAFK
jgi:hypothetical protein